MPGTSHPLQDLWLNEMDLPGVDRDPEACSLSLDDLRPCMKFSDLRCIDVNMEWKVDLTDSDLLILASTWPHLQKLDINATWGWNTSGGITPDGLAQLLRICPSLSGFTLALDTRGYTGSPRSSGRHGVAFSTIDVVDSIIEEEAVPAVAAFFADIVPTSANKVGLDAWTGMPMRKPPNWKVYKDRWSRIFERVVDVVG